jgi:carboxyl-terminal processing protease
MRKLILILLSVAACLTLGSVMTRTHPVIIEARAQEPAAKTKEIDRFITALEHIQTGYVDGLDQSDLIDAAIRGMVGALDAQSSYFDWKLFRDMQVTHSLGPAGLGIETIAEKGRVKVVAPIDDSPAARAGVRPNDIITHIDGIPVEGLTPHVRFFEKTRGQVDTMVRLTILREGEDKPLELMLVRKMLRLNSVRVRRDGDDIGYIRIPLINEWTVQAFGKAVRELSSKLTADKLKGYVLDLRNTPSIAADSAVALADAFLDEGEIVSVRGRTSEQVEHFNAHPGDIINGKRLVVLINGGTASAAEIVAAALQENKRATVIGTRSFGRGSTQTIVPLGARSGALRLTTGRYFTPAGRSFDGAGIVPDIEVLQDVSATQENDKMLTFAYELLRAAPANPVLPPNQKG